MLAGEVADLRRLVRDDLPGLAQQLVDDLPVRDVDQRAEEEGRGRDQGDAPERGELDEPVGEEGGNEGLVK